MLDPSKRFLTLVLVLGTAVLLLAIAIGEGMGDKVLGTATERRLGGLPSIVVTPAPSQTMGPYGPDWKRSQSLAAAPDPGFPDPRIPPQPLPTPPPRPTPGAAPRPTPTYNPAVPVWRQKPLPTVSPSATPAETGVSPAPAKETPVPGPSVPPQD
ncbi:MAG TPA: hypothetical protein VIG46_04765 [Candidatus Baltobacteraceae bacterium]|jgi:hypothetical protein